MIQVNILEQLKTLFEIFKNNKYVIAISIIAIFALIILLVANKFKNKKITKILYILVYLVIFGILIYFYHIEILKLLDYLMNNIFLFLFFPNLAVYILVLVIINSIIMRSTFSKKEKNSNQVVNVIFFILFNIMFYLIIDNIIKNKINVYEQLSIYTNKDLLILVQLSMKLFLVWLIVLLIIKITSKMLEKMHFKKSVNSNLNLNLIINEEEIKNVENSLGVSEVYPYKNLYEPILEIGVNEDNYNVYNDYIDVVPIKKKSIKSIKIKKELENIAKSEEKENFNFNEIYNVFLENKTGILNNEIKEKVENKGEEINSSNVLYEGKSFSDINVLSFDANENSLTLEDECSDDKILNINNNLIKEDLKKNIEFDKKINTEYFVSESYKNKINLDDNMKLIFNENNSSLQKIIFDIEKLKDRPDNKIQIQKIYEEIILNQKDLTLKDYNYLIDMLLTVKK